MKVSARGTVHGLIEGKIYDVISEYDIYYELKLDTGIHYMPKSFFEIVNEAENVEEEN